ncbi:hypothetical protein DAEQUDRAFT_660525 [Daedalea quercina L-15889]|uniref:Uncharacterized protein n=1 Tax=Daedalea quercina L-15889 TaxID=1314783 RepID=A0A165U3E7_9APHY|nr:hypothetical protein DAEQUDRAFT_660525 [Daedalea quercina L-15889]
MTPSYSRSASVRREIAFLRSQLGSTKTEKEEALKRLQAVKDAAKLSLEKSSKRYDLDLEDAINELKTKSRSSFEVVDKVQNSLPDVQELRQAVADAMRKLVDARNRVRELESTQSIDRTARQASSQSLSRAGAIGLYSTDLRCFRIIHLQTRGDNDTEKIRELTGELQEHKAREVAAEKEAESRDSRYQQLLQKLSSVEQRLEAVKVESEIRNEKYVNFVVRDSSYNILEERFEDQSITLRVTRESNGDLQERLITTEATHALQNTASQLDLKIKGQEGELGATLKDHEDKLKNQEELYRARIDAEEKRASRAEYDLAASRAMAQSLQENLATTSAEVQSLREQLDKALLPDPILAEENEEEKSFIKTLVQTSQAIHEQELITKGNDLRRRDNTIKELRAKMHVLESTLAKHLKAQAQTQAKMPPPAAENRSMINPAAWTSSDPSSSPPASGPQAPDRDMPSTNVDNTATAKSTPVPSSLPGRTIPIMPTALVQVTPVQGEIIGEQGKAMQTGLKTPSAYRPPAPELAAGPSGNQVAFSTLAMDSSDEIAEFDVPLATVLRKRDVIESPPRAADNVAASKPPLKRLVCFYLSVSLTTFQIIRYRGPRRVKLMNG